MIRRVGGKFVIYSEEGDILGLHSDIEDAKKQEWFLQRKRIEQKGIIDVDYDEEEQQRMHQEAKPADKYTYPNNGIYTD